MFSEFDDDNDLSEVDVLACPYFDDLTGECNCSDPDIFCDGCPYFLEDYLEDNGFIQREQTDETN